MAETLEQWWAEDAERINRLGELARRSGATVGTIHKPPRLADDGSLHEDERGKAVSDAPDPAEPDGWRPVP